jgi:hypothetical protein
VTDPDDRSRPAGWSPPAPDPYLELADEAAHEAAVRARTEGRHRRERASEVATWIGTLRDLAEREVAVSLRARSGRVHRGAIVGLGPDHVAVRLPAGSLALIALDAVRTVRPEPGRPAPPAMGDREAAQDRTLVEVVHRAVEDRQPLVLVVRDLPDPLHGEVIGLGDDVLTLRLGGADRGTVYLPLDALEEVVLER